THAPLGRSTAACAARTAGGILPPPHPPPYLRRFTAHGMLHLARRYNPMLAVGSLRSVTSQWHISSPPRRHAAFIAVTGVCLKLTRHSTWCTQAYPHVKR